MSSVSSQFLHDRTLTTMTGAFSFEAAVPTGVADANRPSSGGVSATINGFNFGGSDTTCSVRIRQQTAQYVSWVSATSIVFDGEFPGPGDATGTLDALRLTISEIVGEWSLPLDSGLC
jgi:hypothetical protein